MICTWTSYPVKEPEDSTYIAPAVNTLLFASVVTYEHEELSVDNIVAVDVGGK